MMGPVIGNMRRHLVSGNIVLSTGPTVAPEPCRRTRPTRSNPCPIHADDDRRLERGAAGPENFFQLERAVSEDQVQLLRRLTTPHSRAQRAAPDISQHQRDVQQRHFGILVKRT